MAESEDAAWRDERRLPLADLNEAMATYSFDGQVDDATGGDAGAEEAARDEEPPLDADADPTSAEGRRQRPSPDGHPGPV